MSLYDTIDSSVGDVPHELANIIYQYVATPIFPMEFYHQLHIPIIDDIRYEIDEMFLEILPVLVLLFPEYYNEEDGIFEIPFSFEDDDEDIGLISIYEIYEQWSNKFYNRFNISRVVELSQLINTYIDYLKII